MGFQFKHVVLAMLALSLAACSNLPRGAAVEREILETADAPDTDIAVYPVTRAFLPSYTTWPSNNGHRHGEHTNLIDGRAA